MPSTCLRYPDWSIPASSSSPTSTSNLKFAAGSDEFRVRCTKKYPAVVPQTHALAFGEPAANFGFGVLAAMDPPRHVLRLFRIRLARFN